MRSYSSQLREEIEQHGAAFRFIQAEATSLKYTNGRSQIQTSIDKTVVADYVVLALGNFPPGDLRLPGKQNGSTRFVSNPWSRDALVGVPQYSSILLIGSGLTSVDAHPLLLSSVQG